MHDLHVNVVFCVRDVAYIASLYNENLAFTRQLSQIYFTKTGNSTSLVQSTQNVNVS